MTTAMDERKVPTRRISFEESLAHLPKHFAKDGNVFSSHLLAALSSLFPDGEDFFVRSVRHFRDDITDPELKRDVAGFIGQEAVHGREHREFNAKLAQLGYPTQRYEQWTKRSLAFRQKVAPAKSNLAATAALEHYTATIGALLLRSPETRDLIGDQNVRHLFVWHALEETEHKDVAFDVYRAVGGTERMRIWTMNAVTAGFLGSLFVQVILSMLGDRETYRIRTLRDTVKAIRATPLLSRKMWRDLRDYNQKGFHPRMHDTTGLVAEWREKLFGEAGEITDLLPAKAA